MSIAHKCDVTGVYADTMDRFKSYSWQVTKLGKTFTIRLTLDVMDAGQNILELSPAAWTVVIEEVKARIS